MNNPISAYLKHKKHLTQDEADLIQWDLAYVEDLLKAAIDMTYHGNPPGSCDEFLNGLYEFNRKLLKDVRKRAGIETDGE